jgi:glutamyl-tRNA synthetase
MGDPSFEDLVKMGFLPEAVVNYLALLGWSPGNDQEFFTLEELVKVFSIDRINKSSAAFSFDKLTWLNGEHLRSKTQEEFHQFAVEYFPESLLVYDIRKISDLLQIRTEKLTDIPKSVQFFVKVPEYDLEMYNHEKSKSNLENSLVILKAVVPLLKVVKTWDNDTLFQVLKSFAKDQSYKVGTVMWPIRTALSGVAATPGGATALAEILGKEETLQRIEAGIEKLEKYNQPG